MRVTHIIVGLGVGGAENVLRQLILAQRANDPLMQTQVISLTTVGPIGQMLLDDGIEVIALGLKSTLALPGMMVRLRRLLAQWQPDVVQTWMVQANLFGGLAARWAGIRGVIWGIRSTGVAGASRATRLIRRLGAPLSTTVPHTIVCAAEASLRSHVAIGYDAARMVVIPNGFDLQRFHPESSAALAMRSALGIGQHETVIGHVGRWNAAKDHLNFVQAAGVLIRQQPRCRFLMVGRDIGPDNEVLARALEHSGCADRFVLLGERSDIPACLGAMDFFCLSSRAEGFPNVVGEAMAMAVPCVVTDVGDAAMLVGNTGWVVPKEDPIALAKALQMAVTESPAERAARAQRARARVETEFSLQRAHERFTELQRRVALQSRK